MPVTDISALAAPLWEFHWEAPLRAYGSSEENTQGVESFLQHGFKPGSVCQHSLSLSSVLLVQFVFFSGHTANSKVHLVNDLCQRTQEYK